jgi:hypothetical protein
MALESDPNSWVGFLVGSSGLLGGLLYVRRQLSKDNTAIHADKVERDQLARLEAENARLTARLEKAEANPPQRPEDMLMIASLESERDILMRDIRRMIRRLPEEVVDELESNFAALADVEERVEPRSRR